MSKKINFGTINVDAMEKLSAYHKALSELKIIRATYKKEKERLEAEEAHVLKNRDEAMKNGMSLDEAISKFPTEIIHAQIRSAKNKYDEDSKPHNEAKKKAMALLDNSLYYSYQLCMTKGDLSATGVLNLKKGKKSESIKIDKSFKGIIADFLSKIGCKNQDNDTALNKFADVMRVRTAGVIRSNKENTYIKMKSASQFNEIFMLAFLHYTIIEKGVITVNNDNSLSMTVYPDNAE